MIIKSVAGLIIIVSLCCFYWVVFGSNLHSVLAYMCI